MSKVVQVTRKERPAKQIYEPPKLRKHGHIRNITLTDSTGPNFDGGSGANVYSTSGIPSN